MNVEFVKKKLEEIRKRSADPEAAHSLEDSLYEEVLEAIATGSCDDPRECAAQALKTKELKFARWCA